MSTNHQLQHDDILQNRMGLRIAARLSAGANEVSHDVSDRLRVARQQALTRRKRPQALARKATADTPVVLQPGHTAVLGFGGGDRLGFWGRASSAFLLAALAVGLIAINIVQNDDRAVDVADLDAALLTDDLPPQAYTDPGFLQFLKTQSSERTAPQPAERPET